MSTKHVLVVDDQANWRDVISGSLLDFGCSVRTAASVREAWTLLEAMHFDLAILDVRLEDTNPYDVQGMELVEQMHDRLASDFPIIVMTGYSFDGMEEVLKSKFGVRLFIDKGSGFFDDPETFVNNIMSLLS